MKRFIVVLTLCGLLQAPSAVAGAGEDRLRAFLTEVQSLSANFEQVLLDADGAEIQRSGGQVLIQRPWRFRWHYRRPYEQLILADGQRLWIYDRDLQQVTVKQLDSALGRTPAMVLSSDRPVDEAFELTELGDAKGLTWLRLTPKPRDTDYRELRLGFFAETLSVMELHDNLGQVTRLRFTGLTRNPAITHRQFQFSPPTGVDVIDATR